MKIETLKSAIKERQSISFEYNKPGKTPGLRVGDAHAVFIMRKKDGSESTKVHIVQTAGVTDSGQVFPSWRMFDIEELGNVSICNPAQTFEVFPSYNPEWEGYEFVIAKV